MRSRACCRILPARRGTWRCADQTGSRPASSSSAYQAGVELDASGGVPPAPQRKPRTRVPRAPQTRYDESCDHRGHREKHRRGQHVRLAGERRGGRGQAPAAGGFLPRRMVREAAWGLGGMRGTMSEVKATIDIRDELLARARAQAARERTTLAAVVEEGLVLRLRSTAPRGGAMNPLPVSPRRGGLRPGIDGSCNRSLLDAADR